MATTKSNDNAYAAWASDEDTRNPLNARQHEIVLTAVVGRIPLDPTGTGDALAEAFKQAGMFVTERAFDGPWDAEVIFEFGGDEYSVSGHRK